MTKIKLIEYLNRSWMIGEVWKDSKKIAIINKFYSVDENWIYIFDANGGSGTGYTRGELLQKIFIGDCEFEKIEVRQKRKFPIN